MGASIYDVRTEGGQEIPQICGQTVKILLSKKRIGGGQKIPKSCGRHIWKPLLGRTESSTYSEADQTSSTKKVHAAAAATRLICLRQTRPVLSFHKASVVMKRLSCPTETVLSNIITRNIMVLSFKDSPRKPLRRRPTCIDRHRRHCMDLQLVMPWCQIGPNCDH